MTSETIAMLETQLTRWQSYSWTPSPSYFAASIMSDVQEALVRGRKDIAKEGLKAAIYYLVKDGNYIWAEAIDDLLYDLEAPVHSVYYGTEDGHNVYGLESRVTEGLNDIKREIFDVIRRDQLI